MRERTLAGDHRTNNNCEAWHRRFSATIQCHHPSFFKFIKALQKEQLFQVWQRNTPEGWDGTNLFLFLLKIVIVVRQGVMQERRMGNAEAGEAPTRKRKYVETDARLLNIATDYGAPDRPRIQYLKAIAHHLKA